MRRNQALGVAMGLGPSVDLFQGRVIITQVWDLQPRRLRERFYPVQGRGSPEFHKNLKMTRLPKFDPGWGW
jgi:hypothetical protein